MHKIYIGNIDTYCYIDSEDKELVAGFNWFAKEILTYKSYILWANRSRFKVMMHTLIAGAAPNDVVHHINGHGLDNRKNNLLRNDERVCGQTGSSQYRGVSYEKGSGKWRTVMFFKEENKMKGYGRFETELEAAIRYDEVALKEFGEYARLNFEGPDRRL